MEKRSRTEQWQIIIITSAILLVLGFNNVVAFIENLKQAQYLQFLGMIPSSWLNLFILLLLLYVLFENKKFAEKLVGKI